MPHNQFLLVVTLLLAIGAATVLLFRRAGFGSVLALLATGLVLGPHGLELVADGETTLRGFTEFGVVLLLFLIGLETQPARLWRMRRHVFGLGTAQVLVTGTTLALLARWLAGASPSGALVLGYGLALSSTAFVLQLLQESSALPTRHGQAAFSVLLLQDLAVVPLLALMPLLADGGPSERAGNWIAVALPIPALLLLVLVGRWVIPRALDLGARHRNMEAFAMVTGVAVIGAAWIMAEVGLSMALGAFVMGMLLSGSGYVHQIEAEVAPFKGLLLGLFFVSIGLSMDLTLLADHALAVVAAVTVLLAAKTVIMLMLALLFRFDLPTAIRVAFLLPQGGEFGFVLFAAAALAGVLDPALQQAGLLVISISMAATPVMARLGNDWARRLEKVPPAPGDIAAAGDGLDRHVVLAGFGRVGRNIAYMLEQAEIPYVAIDQDVSRVALGRREGRPVYFGSSTDPRLLVQLGVGRASALVITLDSSQAVERVVDTIRSVHPHVQLFVRARDLATRDRLVAAGVNEAIPETIQLSMSLGEAVLRRIGAPDEQIQAVIDTMRQDNYANLRLGAIRERMAEVGRADG